MPRTAAESGPHSQTLSRGIRALEVLAEARNPLTIAELSAALEVHRSIAYRIVRTLEDHALVTRDESGRLSPGAGLSVLARSVSRDLQTASLPELSRLASELKMTAFVAVWDRAECITLATVEPQHNGATLAVRPGTRHSLDQGAPGIAIQSALGREEWEQRAPEIPYRDDADAARERGYSLSHDEVIPGFSSVAVPLRIPHQRPAALAVVYFGGITDHARIGAALAAAAGRIQDAIG
ncbi:IclR family transcriptional regulator [Sinomonas mesophila]|uniref:IclR family transcriptional regulator n=1 Tax=Sinomonas mesophila TaxID=1531955 RepID=UPI0009859472|nr:helix-turn-helix domain-containing protein [Sinomonas mesophila]